MTFFGLTLDQWLVFVGDGITIATHYNQPFGV